MGLFDKFRKKKWEDDDPDVRIQGGSDLYNDKKNVRRNQEILKEMLINDSSSDVKIAAISKINDESAIRMSH